MCSRLSTRHFRYSQSTNTRLCGYKEKQRALLLLNHIYKRLELVGTTLLLLVQRYKLCSALFIGLEGRDLTAAVCEGILQLLKLCALTQAVSFVITDSQCELSLEWDWKW